MSRDHSSKQLRITCTECGRVFKAQVECPKCGHPPRLDDPRLDEFTRQRLVTKHKQETRTFRDAALGLVGAWTRNNPPRRERALAALRLPADFVFPPPPPEFIDAGAVSAAPDDPDPLAGPLDDPLPELDRPTPKRRRRKLKPTR
jgi:hypothetical protein